MINLKNVFEDIKEVFKDFAKQYRITYKIIETNIHILAQSGWTIPMSFTPAETIELLKIDNREDIDDIFLNYYCQNEGEEFDKIVYDIKGNPKLEKWRQLIEECEVAYKINLFNITIPSLLTILEGIIAEFLKPSNYNDVKMIRACNEQIENSDEDSIERLVWISIKGFITCLYEKREFTGQRPLYINRHWILYGRDSTNWRQEDALRLFHAINTLSWLI